MAMGLEILDSIAVTGRLIDEGGHRPVGRKGEFRGVDIPSPPPSLGLIT
jgi:hypothetical protein